MNQHPNAEAPRTLFPWRAVVTGMTTLASVWLLAGCKRNETARQASPVPSAATITAEPNPVPPGPGMGKTTIHWDTGDGTWGQVYLAEPDKPELNFAAGDKGSEDAPWIVPGGVYEFRLYKGTEHTELLGTVKVTRSKQ